MMSASQLKELVDTHAMVVPLSVDQYHEMIRTGILAEGEPIELLDGFLVRKDRSKTGEDPMTVGHEHALVLGKIGRLVSEIERLGGCLRIQQPITLPPDTEPEPDTTIALGGIEGYAKNHPGPGDITCLIEVADSSLHRDRVTKQRIYADNGIPQYLIINLIDGLIEEYRDPKPGTGRYTTTHTIRRDESIRIDIGHGQRLETPAATLLP
jgi:Uma2 family endonuclease